MLLEGVNHVAWISKDAARLGDFYEHGVRRGRRRRRIPTVRVRR